MYKPFVIVITGASRGIGAAIANIFAEDKHGHTIILVSKNAENLKKQAVQLQSRYPRSTVVYRSCNLVSKSDVSNLGSWLNQTYPAIDILVNNAGTFTPGSIHNEADGTLENMLANNLMSAYYLTRQVVPQMITAKRGHIFNICSIASVAAYANGGSYSISKFALLGFGKNLREEMKPHNIKVTNILPGAVYTDSWSESGIDAKRIMESDDIAQLVYTASYLSPQACIEEIIIRPQLGDL